MRITIKLFASLSDYLPPERKHNAIDLDVPADFRLTGVIERFSLPPRLVHLVLINGVYIEPGARPQRQLSEGDVVAIWPPVAGG